MEVVTCECFWLYGIYIHILYMYIHEKDLATIMEYARFHYIGEISNKMSDVDISV